MKAFLVRSYVEYCDTGGTKYVRMVGAMPWQLTGEYARKNVADQFTEAHKAAYHARCLWCDENGNLEIRNPA
jgi:hypothetical protein